MQKINKTKMDVEIFNELDQIINLDLGGRKNRYLYQATREPIPLCLKSAKLIEKSVKKGDTVLITSGFPIVPKNRPETDGPLGAVVLAKALEKLDATPVLVLDELSLEVHRELVDEMGPKGTETKTIPINLAEAKEMCTLILSEYNPQLLIAIERPGAGKDGTYHNMRGEDISSLVGKVDPLFLDAIDKGIPTIGIGDGGNEIGMGNITQSVMENIPYGQFIASTTKVQSLVVSAVSNWGAYGITAALSILTGNQLGHDAKDEKKMIKTCIKSGAVDGVTKKPEHSVDGIPSRIHEHIVDIIRYMSNSALSD